ncbi:MAG TPA: hypothetical protein PKM63_02520 [Panacibacter sp.]|nr:hypothetical protein [Panacibacter sp.]HNP43130.1 hypothetical protein [Panacibacter sp.]
MHTIIAYSPIDSMVEKFQKKGYREFKMTRAGFTSGMGKYYEPRDLQITKVYHFEDMVNPNESSFIYVMKDSNGIQGYSVDAAPEYEKNEEELYHWFITKVPKDNSTD